jgi:hypothetical protein
MAFVNPLALLFTALYGVLALFYLWERWRRRMVVPSLILWETLREDTMRVRRFRPDLRFILQVLLLTCLILGLAQPYFWGPGGTEASRRHIFVLDTSASMQAREGRSSRFAEAQADARRTLQRLRADDEVMLITAGRSPEVALGFTRDHAAVASALDHAVPVEAGGDLALALTFADGCRQRSDVPTELDVFTDLPRRELPVPLRDQVTVFQVGESDDNLGIESLQIFQGRFQDYHAARVYVLVQNFAHRERHGFLTVQLENQVVHRSGFTIAPREAKGYVVDDLPGPGRVVARLDVADALAADNIAYGWIRPVTPVRVLVVSPSSPLTDDLRELAAATPGLQLRIVDPSGYNAVQAQQAELIIFHRFVPDAPPATNALYIYPPKENSLFPVEADATHVEVLDWNVRHAALQSLRPLAALPLQRARIIAPPDWSQVLLWSRTTEREFPLAFAGERDGKRLACLTFDLEAERLLSADNVNFFLFFMNLLAWLSPDHGDAVVVNTGDVQSFTDLSVDPLEVQDPRGNVYTLPPGQPTVEPLFAGEYRVGADGRRQTLLANFFDPVESDIGRASREPPVVPRRLQPANASGGAAPVGGPRDEYGRWLYYAAAVLFVLESTLARRMAA